MFQTLAEALLPDDDILAVKYFTARIKPSRIDPRKHIRQQVYFRALETLPKVHVATSDSDLEEPFRVVTRELNLPLILLHPYVADATGALREPAKKLREYADGRIKKIREGLLAASQLPEQIDDRHGRITRPFEWYPQP